MVASHTTVEQIVKIMLKYMNKKDALRMAREIHNHVKGNQSVTHTFHRIVQELVEMDGDLVSVINRVINRESGEYE